MSKYEIGDKVWVAYVAGDFQEALRVNPTEIVGVYLLYDRWYYGTKLNTRSGSDRYCDIPEDHIFMSKEEALAHLKDVKLHKLEQDLRTWKSLAEKAEKEIRKQRQEIEEWEHESNS